MKKVLSYFFKNKHERMLRSFAPTVKAINNLEPTMQQMSDEELQSQTEKFKKRLKQGETLEKLLVEAFATVREASVRVLKMRPFDVQLLGAIVLFRGSIAEMKTGEGKTLTATFPLYLIGLEGKGAHLITVNDYLAARDAKEMGALYEWLNLSTGCIVSDMEDEDRMQAYQCDITYGTNNEFAFDYLRDNMKFSLEDYVQRDFHYCIVDEVDSILIDEARTPLLISGAGEGDSKLYEVTNKAIPSLKQKTDFTIDEKSKTAILTDSGVLVLQEILKIENLYDIKNSELLHHLNQSLRAHHLFKRDVDYVVKNNEVIIVDEFTGRLKEGSRWSDGLHQAIEAKEFVTINQENQTLASITFQNFFRLYKKLSGMTGTADTEAEEFQRIYNLDVTVIPTHLPMIRDDQADVIYKNNNAKYKAIANLVEKLYEKGQPILIGTVSIDSSELLSNALRTKNIPHNVLNAKHHEQEAQIIINAGKTKSITIATNMAGRGTDIKLGEGVKELGGLFILGTERHESRRIDNQLRGRSGRQGDPGASKFFLSLEDNLLRIFSSDRISKIMGTLGMEEDEPIEHRMITNAIAKAQKKVEAHNFDIRKHLLEYDNVMNEQRKVIYSIRREILGDKNNVDFIKEMVEDVVGFIVQDHTPSKQIPLENYPWDKIAKDFDNLIQKENNLSWEECSKNYEGNIESYLTSIALETLDKKFSQHSQEEMSLAARELLLTTFDQYWKSHLAAMDHLKEGINLKAYAQKDPLTEYKTESFALFEEMRVQVKRAISHASFAIHIYTEEEIRELKQKQQEMLDRQLANSKQENKPPKPIKKGNKVGRNTPCPCGSGKKYKHCCGA